MADQPAGRAARLAADRAAVERELDEIELLLRQARTEADRHTARRQAASERFSALLDESGAAASLREAYEQLTLQSQRAALMTTQIEVLEGKEKVLKRLAAALDQAAVLDEAAATAGADGEARATEPVPAEQSPAPSPGGQSRAVRAAQEEMRRSIARQMHDGPAQSIANIALQAQVVQRLLARDPGAAGRELEELRAMVQHALDATKSFIFDVRPMVLDDLGLVPTLRRAVAERERRSGVPVRFESAGADRRLEPEMEINLFRIVDDALAAFLAAEPTEVALRLNWTEDRLNVSLRSRPPLDESSEAALAQRQRSASGGELPAALADMIREQDAGAAAQESARLRTYGLPANLWREIDERARSVGIDVRQADEGLVLEATVALANGTTRKQDSFPIHTRPGQP